MPPKTLRSADLLLCLWLAASAALIFLITAEIVRTNRFERAERQFHCTVEALETVLSETAASYTAAPPGHTDRVHSACLRDGSFALTDTLAERAESLLREMERACPRRFIPRLTGCLKQYERLDRIRTTVEIPFIYKRLPNIFPEGTAILR